MGYRDDDRYGGERWRDRGEGSRWRGEDRSWRDDDRERGSWRRESGSHGRGAGDDDRGFLDRAGDEVRSWFGDDEAQRRREMDERRWEREHGVSGQRDNDYGRRAFTGGDDYRRPATRAAEQGGVGSFGGGGFGGGWGNQAGESWNRERPGRPGWFTDSEGGERGYRRGGGGGRWPADPQGPSGEGGYRTGGAGGAWPTDIQGNLDRGGSFGSPSDYGRGYGRSDALGGAGGYASAFGAGRDFGGRDHDPHYSEWRRRQIDALDRDYDEYRREHQSKFEQEFGGWRSKRQGQRQLLNRVSEHMDVVGSDGTHIGTVDKVSGNRIILTKSDAASGGMHHSVPCSWVETVDQKVTLNRSAEQAKSDWREEEANRALFERPDSGSEGPHVLNRSFAGTYDEDEGAVRSSRAGEAGARSDRNAADSPQGDRKR